MVWQWMSREKKITCQRVADLLSDYLAGELSEAEVRAIRAHLKGCDNCEVFFESLKTTVRMTKRLKPEEIPAAVVDRLESFLKQRINLKS
jgi:predicted anti-sigma-YlaC factor YlaD